MRILLIFFFSWINPALIFSGTWWVGPDHDFQKPSQVATLVQNGDTVLIEAGVYLNDVAKWTADSLVIRGINGRAHLKCGGNIYGGKAIWVIAGDDVTVEYIEFSEATSPDRNGAGIRSEGINLTLRHCYFHHNEDGILAGDIASGDFLIEYCEFDSNGYPDGLAHNLYINHANSLTFRFNYSHDAVVGHELKSRAYQNYIYCNRFSDENGSASRSIDLPNGGFCVVVGNLIVQDLYSQNNNLIGFGMEGLSNPNATLYLAYNTLVNNKQVGSFVQYPNNTPYIKAWNNIFAGPGVLFSGNVLQLDTLHNLHAAVDYFQFVGPASYDFHLTEESPAQNQAADPGFAGPLPLLPTSEYVHPTRDTLRQHGLDLGAFSAFFQPTNLSSESVPWNGLLFPNPTTGRIELKSEETAAIRRIVNTQGQSVSVPTDSRLLDISREPAGMYWVCIEWHGRLRWIPLFKQ